MKSNSFNLDKFDMEKSVKRLESIVMSFNKENQQN
jgi:hypothetical protein